MSLPSVRKTQAWSLGPMLTILGIGVVGVVIYAYVSGAPQIDLAAKAAKKVISEARILVTSKAPALDEETEFFNKQTANLGTVNECLPIHLRDTLRGSAKVGILLLHCSDAALAGDALGVQLTENFAVHEAIARRYNFWRRIYSLWGKDQYVMHLSEFPEIVLEAYDVSRMGSDAGAVKREIEAKRLAKERRALYRKLFNTMHRHRHDESQFTPAMQRLARAMAHIPHKNKYLMAGRSIRLQRGQRDFIASGLAVGPRYLPHIEQEFKEQNVPVEIARLAYVESSFNLKAHSKVGASGVYQIMPATGRQYLKMHSGVDERLDPIKASRAAAKLLKLNYKLTGSWPLAITAYNHGVGGIRRAVRAVGSNDIVQLINRYEGNAFGFASKNFYASFLGMLATLNDAERIFPDIQPVQPIAFTSVRLPKSMSLVQIRKKYGLTNAEIGEYNPDILRSHLRASGWLPRGYVVKMPVKAIASSESPKPEVKQVNSPNT